jgi:hypothetical protein
MGGEYISERASGGTIEKRRGMRWFACCIAMVALGGSLWAAWSSSDCGGCRASSALLPGIPLAWMGAAFYAVLAVTAGGRGFSRWTKAGFFVASGMHVVLLTLLAQERIFCGGCVTAGAAALVGGSMSVAVRPRVGRWALAVVVAAGLVTLGGFVTVQMVQAQNEARLMKELLEDQRPGFNRAGHVRLVVFEREGCKHCVEFEEQVLPQLTAALGGALQVERRKATLTMESPTIVVLGKGSRLFVGLPEYKDLEDAIREVR